MIVWRFHFKSRFAQVVSGLCLTLFGLMGSTEVQAAAPYIVADSMRGAALGLHFEILPDEGAQLSLADITKDQNHPFQPSRETVPNFGLKRAHQWVKFTLHNPMNHTVTVLIENKFTLSDRTEIYFQAPDGSWHKKEAGDQVSFIERDVSTRQPVFRLDLAPGSHLIYARSFADGAHQLPLHIWTQDEFFSHNAREYGWIGVLIGFHVVVCLYNFFLFFSLRDSTYLYYVLYVLFNLCYQASSLGILQQTYSALGMGETLSNRFMILSVDCVSIAALLFSYHFLNIRQRLPIFRGIFLGIGGMNALNLFVTSFVSVWYGTAICIITASMATTALIASGFLIARQRYAPAVFYAVAWGCYLFGVTATVTNLIGLLPTSQFTRWGQFTGGAIEVAILSLALGARINAKRRQTVQMITQLNHDLESKVEERTSEIQSLLRHIPQGILSIGGDGRITPNYSAQLPAILEHDSIAGQSFREIVLDRSTLPPDEKDQAWQAIQAMVGEKSISFELNVSKLPRQLTYSMSTHIKALRLTWNRELNADDDIKHILVTLLDVSSEVAAQQEIERQNQEFEIIKQLVGLGGRKSLQFFNSGDLLIEENDRLVRSARIDSDSVKILFVNTHTLKGAARSLQLKELANKLHEAESYYSQILRGGQSIDPIRIQREFREAQTIYQRYRHVNRETLGRLDDVKKVIVERDFLQDHVKLLRHVTESGALSRPLQSQLMVHRDEITQLIFTQLQGFIDELQLQTNKIAADLGRELPIFRIEASDILISTSQEMALKNAFIHLLRNALDHGIESAPLRTSQGKSARGTLCVSAQEEDGQIVIDFKDDGKGLDIGRIRELCKADSRRSARELASLIFEAGFSTTETVSQISGRGVGLAAVRQFLETEGGAVEIVLGERVGGAGEFYQFAIRMTLPAVASVDGMRNVSKAG